MITTELDRLFPEPIEILAEPGRFLVASAATAVAQIIGKAVRDGKLCYYLNDGVYHTFSGVIFDHCQVSPEEFQERSGSNLLRLRAHLRRPRYHQPDRATAGYGDGRTGLRREHRRLFRRQQHILQRLPASEGRAREPVIFGKRKPGLSSIRKPSSPLSKFSSSGRFGRISRGGPTEDHPVCLQQSHPSTGSK